MLIKELIVRHVDPHGALHERGIRLDDTQVPPGITIHHEVDHGDQADANHPDDADDRDDAADADDADDRDDAADADDADDRDDAADADDAADRDHRDDGGHTVAPVAGDLILVSAPVGLGLPEHIDTDLPIGATLVLLLEVELAELPVDRVLAALALANLQVVEAAVLSGTPTATVAVVAARTDDFVVPAPSFAQNLEPGEHTGPAVLRRLIGEHALEGLVQRAREHALQSQVEEGETRLGQVSADLEKLRSESRTREAALSRDLETARKETAAERKALKSLRSSTSFKVASRLAKASGVARRIIPKPGGGKARG